MKGDPLCPKCAGSGTRTDEHGPRCIYYRPELLLAQVRTAQILAAERVVVESLTAMERGA